MAEAADATLFGVLCVLDGVRAIEAEEEKAEYVIAAVRAGETTQISPTETFLHDIYRSER